MAAPTPSPIRFILSLQVPQGVALEVTDRRNRLSRLGYISAPMNPLLPLLESAEEIRSPVPGLLPRCPRAPRPGRNPVPSADGQWWIRPVDGYGWFEDLKEALISSGSGEPVPPDLRLFPPDPGIAVARRPDGEPAPDLPVMTAEGWRAMVLQCHEIRWNPDRAWYLDLRWRTVWTRRLARAPETTNNNKNT